VIKALNRAYDVEETRPFWVKAPLAVGLTILAAVFFTTSFTVLILGQAFATEIGEFVGLEGASATAFSLLRFPIVFVLLAFAMAFVYWAAPNISIPFRWVSPGALLFIIGWIVFTVGFAFYVANFGSYQSTYGTLGGVVILLIWLYMSSLIMLLGAELNAVLQSKVAPDKMLGPVAQDHRGEVAEERQQAGSATPEGRRGRQASPAAEPAGTGTLALGAVLGVLSVRRAMLDGSGKASNGSFVSRLGWREPQDEAGDSAVAGEADTVSTGTPAS
jgi:membrane protein